MTYSGLVDLMTKRAEYVLCLPAKSIRSRSRALPVSLARACIALVLREELGLSIQRIGDLLGVDHSSVGYMVRKAERACNAGDWDALDLVEDLIELLKGASQSRVS